MTDIKVMNIMMACDENLYLRDAVQYYKQMGFANIVLCDNSPEHGEWPQVVIGDYIREGFVIYENFRRAGDKVNTPKLLENVYTDMFAKYRDQYDWISTFDVDEYPTFRGFASIGEYLQDPAVKDANMIKLNWMCYGDNGHSHYDTRPVTERFPNPSKPIDFKDAAGNYPSNASTKMLINCAKTKVAQFLTPHIAVTEGFDKDDFVCVTGGGLKTNQKSGIAPIDYRMAWLRHYRTRTIEEFLYRRCAGSIYNAEGRHIGSDEMIRTFTSENEMTPEKQKVVDDFFAGPGAAYKAADKECK